jgi:hypothetical protein
MMATARRIRWDDVPDAFALLGRAVAVGIGRGKETPFGRGRFLAADPRGGALVIGPDRSADSVHAPAGRLVDQAERLAAAFHGSADRKAWELRGFPRDWDYLGPARTICYESDKVNGGGTGRPELFIHEFSPGARAYVAGDFLAILGDKIRVDASGVRN